MVLPINDNGIHSPQGRGGEDASPLSPHFSNLEGQQKSWQFIIDKDRMLTLHFWYRMMWLRWHNFIFCRNTDTHIPCHVNFNKHIDTAATLNSSSSSTCLENHHYVTIMTQWINGLYFSAMTFWTTAHLSLKAFTWKLVVQLGRLMVYVLPWVLISVCLKEQSSCCIFTDKMRSKPKMLAYFTF